MDKKKSNKRDPLCHSTPGPGGSQPNKGVRILNFPPDDGGLSELIRITIGYTWLLIIAIWGGTVSYMSRLKKNKTTFSVVELLGEWMVSGFAGIITALLLEDMGFSPHFIMGCAGMAGHMGGRAVYLLERGFTNFISNRKQ